MFRAVAFWCAVLGVFLCAWGWIENTWAASFGEPYRSAYAGRAELFFWLLLLALLTALILAWKWIRLTVKHLASFVRHRERVTPDRSIPR
jgi:hypothetical protein